MQDQPGLFAQVSVQPPEPPPQQRGTVDVERIRLLAIASASGTRYCFHHEAFERDTWIWLVGRRHMILCASAGLELGGEKWNGIHEGRVRTLSHERKSPPVPPLRPLRRP